MSSSDSLTTLMQSRRTIHLFKPEMPPREIILKALDVARWAPNHRLTEPWRFYLLGSESIQVLMAQTLEAIAARQGAQAAQNKRVMWEGIPGWLVLTSLRAADTEVSRENYAACCCAAQNMQLYLWQEGVGVKWSTGPVVKHPRFYEVLGLDAEVEEVVGLFWFGYPSETPASQRKPIDAVFKDLP